MEISRYRHEHLRWLEVALVVLLMVVFIGVALRRFQELSLAAEKVSVAHTVSALQVGLSNRATVLAMHGDTEAIARLSEANPAEFLDLGGEFNIAPEPIGPEAMRPRRWYYDPSSHILTYRVDHGEALVTTLEPPARIRLRVQVDYVDADSNGRFDKPRDTLSRIALLPLESYGWREERP